jgi:putative DNA primase/helicase
MDARAPLLPLDLPKYSVPRQVEADLWRIAQMMILPGRAANLTDFVHMGRVVCRRARSRNYEKGDVSAWLQRYAEAHLEGEVIQDALEAALAEWEDDESSDAQRPPEFSDDALANIFAQRHREDLRYVAAWNRWLIYEGGSWRFDETLQAFDLARNICREAATECVNKWSVKTALASAKTVAAVERLAKADRRLAATVNQWDDDPLLLNTPGGVINLRTGESRPARPEDHMTKITAVAPGGDCPIWKRFLARITNDDPELVNFLQRVIGYSLTGVTTEHALFFCYGTGANGKSVLINTVAEICGGYHKTAPIETFTVSANERHPTDLAGLHGARLVTAVETEEGRRWAEAKIKTLTGGDKISARFMRQDFFEFTPQFKLLIAGNHKPGLKSVDEAIRRRFHLIPFAVKIPDAEQDKGLTEKLKAEWPGILAWMIEGCLAWQRDGLVPPAAVVDATAAYLEAEDAIATWIEESCERNPEAFETRNALFGSWTAWVARTGEATISRNTFLAAIGLRGFIERKRKGVRGFMGWRVKQEFDE